jgi:putative ABC transport system permease protein
MSGKFTLASALRIAWRETISSRWRFLFVVLAILIGVATLTAVRSFSASFRNMLLEQARTLMAGDVSVRLFILPTPEQQAVIDELSRSNVRVTQVTETVTMAAADGAPAPMLVSLKAVDAKDYPFYGRIAMEPDLSTAQAIAANGIAVTPDLLLRLNLKVGDTLRLGGKNFVVRATIVTEPDRMSGSLNVGPRVMLSRESLASTGLIQPGSRAAQRFLFYLGADGAQRVEALRGRLKDSFPDAQIVDFRETHPLISRGLNQSTTFLSMVSLVALIIGALGVATSIHSHLQQRMDTIAVMKCMGATSRQVMMIFAGQALLLGLCGSLPGVALGAVAQGFFPLLIRKYFQIEPRLVFDFASLGQGLLAGLLSTMLFAVPPLLSIRKIRPGALLRREMAATRPAWSQRLREAMPALFAILLIALGIVGLAAGLAIGKWQDAVRLGMWFAIGLGVCLLLMAAAARGLVLVLQLMQRSSGHALPATWRQGIANIYRPGSQVTATIVALGTGVTFTVSIWLVQNTLLSEMRESAPPGMKNVWLVDIQPAQKEPIEQIVRQQAGRLSDLEMVPSVAVRLSAINGAKLNPEALKGWARRFLFTRSVMWAGTLPNSTKVLAGQWWAEAETAEPLVSISEDAARLLQLKPGAEMEFQSYGRNFRTRVVAVHRMEATRAGANSDFIFPRKVLDGLPVIYFGGVRMRNSEIPALQRALYARFPTVSTVNVADILVIVQEVVDQISFVIRFLSGFAILAGLVILASAIAGTRFRRVRETVILKTLGGTRRQVASVFSVEFLLLGALAGLLGSLLANGFTALLMQRFFEDSQFNGHPLSILVSMVSAALLATITGWLASARLLSMKPLAVLREEVS